MKYTSNYNLKKPEGTDIVNIDDLNDNADILDQKLKEVENKADNAPPNSVNDAAIGSRTPDQSQAPASPGTGTLTQLVSWLANRIKTITGKTNWWDAPPTTLQAAKNHIDSAAPHSGHETPSGAQAKVDTHANSKQSHGISSGYYIAKTSRSDQLPAWNDIQGKPDLASAADLDAHLADYAQHGVTMGRENDLYVAKIRSIFEFTPLEANYGGRIEAIAIDDEFVYVGGWTTQTVRKLRKSDLSQVAESANYGGEIEAIAIDDEFVYVGGAITRTVKKLRKSDLSQVAESASYSTGYGGIRAIAIDDEFVYVGGGGNQTVKKLRKSDLSQVAESESYDGNIIAIATDDEFVYIIGGTAIRVRKLRKSDLSQVAESENYGGIIEAIAIDDEFVYIGGETTQTVKKLNKSDLSQVAESENYGGIIEAIAIDDEFVYVGGWTTKTVRKLRKSNLSQVAESENYGGAILAIATDDEFVYIGGETTQTVRVIENRDLIKIIRRYQ